MSDCLPIRVCAADGRVRSGLPLAEGRNLLLVSRSEVWGQAVREATLDFGDSVLACTAREALAHLAGSSSRHSHILVDHADADGLFDELAHLVLEAGVQGTEMHALGLAEGRPPYIRTILEASARSVREALMTGYPPPDQTAIDPADLRAALGGTMIENRYQPIVGIADRRVIGLEALARLNHPEMGTLLPERFIPQIEDAGLGAKLTDLVSGRAFADMTGPWMAAQGTRMSVNFPLDVLLDCAALCRLEEQRTAFGIPAGRIIIELTESRPVEDFPALGKSIEHLRGLGYGVAIDDVGPAVPKLTQLLDLPFSSLKLDKELVKHVNESDPIRAFLAAAIAQAKHHGLTVVGEGVETAALWDRMQEMGVDEAQGFLIARPLPLAAVPIWSDAWSAHAVNKG